MTAKTNVSTNFKMHPIMSQFPKFNEYEYEGSKGFMNIIRHRIISKANNKDVLRTYDHRLAVKNVE